MNEFLRRTDVIDWDDSMVSSVARSLAVDNNPLETASRCFEWVRDSISHSFDVTAECVSCTASETLKNRTGICYAKSHVLAALLRANGIPAGFGYQRLSLDDAGTRFCLHGFNFVHLDDHGWYAIDPRGNRDEITTKFDPPKVHLAFKTSLPGEQTLTTICSEPLRVVVECLRRHTTVSALRNGLPDLDARQMITIAGTQPLA